jgi:catechol 2,3-dioxygenase-like lactoylglutathione lyase family enzyme
MAATTGRPVDFAHIGLHVSDLDRSIRFYRDIIGLDERDRRFRDEPYLGVLTGYEGLRFEACLMVDPASGLLLELIQMHSHTGASAEPGTANPGTAHICFIVDDVDAIYERALAAGHAAVNPPVTPTAGYWKGGRSVYLLDPDRIRIELVKPGPEG